MINKTTNELSLSICNKTNITICIPTYKRPAMLARCLDSMAMLQHDGFSYSVVVADNDARQSARVIAENWRAQKRIDIRYVVEPEQNISLARNKAVASSLGEFIAFIDDDEFPEPRWLFYLFGALKKFSADGVLGPVIPSYAGKPPDWLVKSGLCERPFFNTGTSLNNSKYMRTGNVLFKRSIFDGLDFPFNPRMGRSGGEDTDFFERMLLKGKFFVWCNEARVFEEVPEERQKLAYHVKRACMRGVNSADKEPLFGVRTIRSFFAVIIYTIILPFMLCAGRHLYAKYLIKNCDHLSKLLAHIGVKLIRERRF